MDQFRPSRPVRVLVVDDDPDFAALTETYLERGDDPIEVETATSAEEGLARLDEDGGFDCVVSDYDMPGMDGLEFLEAVKDRSIEVPFVLFTGKGSEEIASRAISAGVTDYLQKSGGPGQFERLANRLVHAARSDRAESEAEATRAHLRTLVDSATDVVLTIDESSTIRFVNRAVESVFGYAPGMVEGEPLTMLMPERFREPHLRSIRRYSEEGERQVDWTQVEFPGLHRDGHEVPLSISFGEFTRNGERFFVGIIRDVSEREERERELTQYETVVENLEDAVWMIDADGVLTFVNGQVADQLSLPREEIVGRQFTDVLLTDEGVSQAVVEAFRADVESVLEGERESVRREVTLPRDGTRVVHDVRVVPVEAEGEVVGAVGLNRDITERERLRSDLEAMLGLLCAADSEAGSRDA